MNEATRHYVDSFIRSITGLSELSPLGGELRQECFAALARTEEIGGPRDEWDNWDWQFSKAKDAGLSYRPWLDERILHACGVSPPTGAWPDGKRFALCLTHDVDGTNWPNARRAILRETRRLFSSPSGASMTLKRAARALRSRIGAGATASRSRRITPRHLDAWLDLESRYGFRSTFLVFSAAASDLHPLDCTYRLTDAIPHRGGAIALKDVLKESADAGWEIGLHGSYRSAVESGRLALERQHIERVLGRPVTSTRQHYLRWDATLTPRLQQDAGLLADSTQGYNRNIGFRAGTSFPYWCWDHSSGRPSGVLEIPQHIMDGALFERSSLAYDTEQAIEHCVQLLDAVERVGGCLALNFHPDHAHEDRHWETYAAVLAEARRRNAWGCTMEQLRQWWSARERRLRDAVPS